MKKTIMITLLVLMLLLTQISAMSINETPQYLSKSDTSYIMNYVEKMVINSYEEYYNIPEMKVTINEVSYKEDKMIVDLSTSFKKVLKATSALELPYVIGMMEERNQLTSENEIHEADAYIDALVMDLEDNYIGVLQEENADFRISIPYGGKAVQLMNMEEQINMEFVGDFGYSSGMDAFSPPSVDELKENGQSFLREVVTQENQINSEVTILSAQNYDRIKARDYIRKWTDSCGGCHCSSCDPSKTVYNSAYTSYHNNDCANFVSQAIYAGGLPTDSTWAPGKIAWINTGYSASYYGLTEYMVDKGYFFASTDKNKAFAGSIVVWTTYSHVGMVDQNDTVTMTFCAHTNDRKSSSFKTLTGIRFLIPVWDSYAGKWTPR